MTLNERKNSMIISAEHFEKFIGFTINVSIIECEFEGKRIKNYQIAIGDPVASQIRRDAAFAELKCRFYFEGFTKPGEIRFDRINIHVDLVGDTYKVTKITRS